MSGTEPDASTETAEAHGEETPERASARPRALLSEVLRSGVGRVDQGARTARRTVRRSKLRADRLPLVGEGAEIELERAALLQALAERAEGSRKADLLFSAAELWERQGHQEATDTALQNALLAEPGHLPALRALRRRSAAAGDLEAVATLAEREAAIPDASPRERALALTTRAEVLYRGLFRPTEALEAAKQALQHDGEQLPAALLMAEISFDRNEPSEAAHALETAARAWPQARFRRALWLEAAGCHLRARAWDAAVHALQRAEEADPQAVDVVLELARAQRAAGHTADAVASLKRGAEIAPSTVLGEALLRIAARWLMGDGRHEASLDLLQGRHQAATHRLRAEIARSHAAAIQRRDALQAWARTSEGWEHALALLDLAEHFGRGGDLRRARDSLQQATATDPNLASMVAVQHAWQRGDAEAIDPVVPAARPLTEAARIAAACASHAQEAALLARASEHTLSVTIDTLHLDAALATGDLETARERLQRRASLAPLHRRLSARLALLELSDTAEERLRFLEDARRDTTGIPLLLRALARRAEEPSRRARLWLEEYATASGSRAAFAATMAARCRAEAGEDDAPQLLAALNAQPGYPPAAWELTRLAAERDDLALMRRVDTHLAECAPHAHAEAVHHTRAGWFARRLGEHASAREHLDRALDGVDDPSLLQLRTQLAWEHPDLQGAQAALRTARTQDDGRLSRAWYHLAALMFEGVGRSREAAQLHRHALQTVDVLDGHAELALDRVEAISAEHARMTQRLSGRVRDARSVGARLTALEALAALQAYDQADIEAAAETWNAILQSAPDHIPALRALQRQLADEGDDEGLLAVETTLARQLSDRKDAATHLETGLRLRRALGGYTGDPAASLLLRDGPGVVLDEWLSVQLEGAARGHRDGERLRHALQARATLASRSHDRIVAALRWAEQLEDDGQLAQAAARLNEALQSTAAEHPSAYERLGTLWQRTGDSARAAQAYAQAAVGFSSPAHRARLWHTAAQLWESVNEEEAALEAYLHAARFDVTYRDVFERGRALLAPRGDEARLAELIDRRLEHPGEPTLLAELHLQLARLRLHLGQPEAVGQACAAALDLDPHRIERLQAIADLCAQAGHWILATDALIRRARLTRDAEPLHDIYLRLADIYELHRPDPHRAQAALERAIALDHRDTDTMRRLAELLSRQGHAAHAEPWLRRALELAPDDATACELSVRLAEASQAQGHHDEARAVLEDAQRRGTTSGALLRALAAQDPRPDAPWVERALLPLRQRVQTRADDIEAWRCMLDVLDAVEREDAAHCVASLAAAVGVREADMLERLAPGRSAPPAGARAFGASCDALIAPDALDATTRQVLHEAEPALRKLILPNQRPHGERLKRAGPGLEEAISRVCEWSGEARPRIFVADDATRACSVLRADPLQLVLSEELVSRDDAAEQVFHLVRAVELARTRLYILTRGTPYDAAMAVLALLRAFEPEYDAPVSNEAELDERTRRMTRVLTRKQKQRLREPVSTLARRDDFDAAGLRRASRELADRTAFVATGNAPLALDQVLRRTEPSVPTAPGPWSRVMRVHPELASLFGFVLSDACFRARMGEA